MNGFSVRIELPYKTITEGTNTMDNLYSNTIPAECKRGAHLCAEDRGAIQQLKKLFYSNRVIAREIGCSPSMVGFLFSLD